jgi:hypothetical protein
MHLLRIALRRSAFRPAVETAMINLRCGSCGAASMLLLRLDCFRSVLL